MLMFLSARDPSPSALEKGRPAAAARQTRSARRPKPKAETMIKVQEARSLVVIPGAVPRTRR